MNKQMLEKNDTNEEEAIINKTLVYLQNYREMERYIKEAVSEASQIDVAQYNISAENAFLQTIRESRAETIIMFEHLKKALKSLEEDAKATGESYKYEALESIYVKGQTYEDVARIHNCGRNSPKRWCKCMIKKLAVKLFGAKAIENDNNGIKSE